MISSRFFNRIFLYFCDDPEYVQRCVYYSNPTFKNQIYLRQKYKNISSEKEKKTLTFVQFLYIYSYLYYLVEYLIFVYRLFCNAGHRPNGYEIAKKSPKCHSIRFWKFCSWYLVYELGFRRVPSSVFPGLGHGFV